MKILKVDCYCHSKNNFNKMAAKKKAKKASKKKGGKKAKKR